MAGAGLGAGPPRRIFGLGPVIPMPLDLDAIARQHTHLEGEKLLRALIAGPLAGKIAVVSSFGTESAVILHMVARIDAATPVLFIDTGKLFQETRSYRSTLIDRLGLKDARVLEPDAADLDRHDPGGDLNARDADRCCHIRKTLPLEAGLDGFLGWVSGRKRYHGGARATISTVEAVDGRLKIDPLAHWGRATVEAYRQVHELPEHPLTARGYFSVGCVPCTDVAGSANDPRAGRWAGKSKTECGIHFTRNGKPVRALSNGREPAETKAN